MPKGQKLQDRFITVCRTKHLAISTEREYWHWVRKFIQFHGIKTEAELLREPEQKFSDFISAESRRGVAASTQNQAWNEAEAAKTKPQMDADKRR